MILDKAIKHCEEKAKELREQPFKEKMDIEDIATCEECAEEHEQLAEWLKDYKKLLEMPKGDLISREVLKKHITETFEIEEKIDKKWAMGLKYSLKIIDNTPAASFAISPDYVTELQNLIKELTKQLEEAERPQGEWVGNAFDEHHCNRCGHPALWEEEPDNYYEVQSNFCPNCGADMRGKENETAN